MKNLRFLGFIQGKVRLAASVMCFDTSCISSLIESMLSCIELMKGLTTSDPAARKDRVAPESSALVQSIQVELLSEFSIKSVGISILTEVI